MAKLRQKWTKLQFQASRDFNDKFFDNYVFKMIERNPILSFETTFIIVESFWGDLVPKKSKIVVFAP